MPREPDLDIFLSTWSNDPLPWIGIALATGAYLAGVWLVDRAHPATHVPRWRIAVWLAGLAVIAVALASAVDVYAESLFAVHMVQHLLLAMVAPPLLALGAPITLALRVSGPGVRHRRLLPMLHSRIARVVASPLVAWSAITVAMWFTHFSPLYNAALEDPGLHVAEHAIFLGTGLLFWWAAVAADPRPRRLDYGVRLALVGLQMPVNAVVGLAIYFAPTVLYPHYAAGARAWGRDPLTDQQIGGVIMWGVGDLLLLATFLAIVVAWMRADERRSRLRDGRRRPYRT